MAAAASNLRRWTVTVLASCLIVLLAACSASKSSGGKGPGGAAQDQYYVSVGDSYAAGFQPTAQGKGRTTTDGFAYQVANGAASKGYHLQLANFGCSSATTTSLRQQLGCKPYNLGPGGIPYDGKTQVDAAAAFLRQHPGKVALISVVIGGNDVIRCRVAPQVVPCVLDAIQQIRTNLAPILQELRDAAGPATPIFGLTYPDVVLGAYISSDPKLKPVAQPSVTAFRTLLNPVLQSAYTAAGGQFLDVTAATGAYLPFDQTVDLPPYGTIPAPVAKVCQLTFFCQFNDIHPRPEGHKLIADLIVGALPPRSG